MVIFHSYLSLPEGIWLGIPTIPGNTVKRRHQLWEVQRRIQWRLFDITWGQSLIPKRDTTGNSMGIRWEFYGDIWLVGGAMCPSWKMMEFVNGWWIIPNIMEHKKCSKPPTRYSRCTISRVIISIILRLAGFFWMDTEHITQQLSSTRHVALERQRVFWNRSVWLLAAGDSSTHQPWRQPDFNKLRSTSCSRFPKPIHKY